MIELKYFEVRKQDEECVSTMPVCGGNLCCGKAMRVTPKNPQGKAVNYNDKVQNTMDSKIWLNTNSDWLNFEEHTICNDRTSTMWQSPDDASVKYSFTCFEHMYLNRTVNQ